MVMQRGTCSLFVVAMLCALGAAPSALAAGVPLGGFVPFMGIGLTRQFDTFDSDPNGTFFIADPRFTWSGTPMGPGGTPYFDLALLDTGAATHILTHQAASNTGFGIHTPFSGEPDGFGGTNTQKIFGASGQIDLLINDPLGIYAGGLAHGSSNGTTLTMMTSFLRGQSSVATLEAPEVGWDLPNVLGLPMAAHHAIMIRNDQPQIFQHQGRTVRTPNVELIDIGTGNQQQIQRRVDLKLRPSAGFIQGPFYVQGGDIFNLKLHENPASPTVVENGGLFLETNLANGPKSLLAKELLFDTGADLTVLSQTTAKRLGFDALTDQPDFILEVEGAGGVTGGVPGFFLDELSFDTVGGSFTLQNVPVAVLDLPNPNDPANVVDGIIGMHLFNGRNLVIDANPAASPGGGAPPRLYISDPVTETHNWSSNAASETWSTAGNWSAADTPGPLWIANVANVSGTNQTAVVTTNSQVFQLVVSGTPTARMAVRINAGATLTTFADTQIATGGRVEIAAGGKLDTQFVNIEGGTLAGSGSIFAGTGPIHSPVRNLNGRIEPGTLATPVGTLTIDGDLSQQVGGTLAIDLGGTLASQYDRLAIERFAFLDGTLEVSLADLGSGLFAPSVGNAFTILTATAGVNGTFDQLHLPDGFLWNIAYNATSVVLSVTGIGLGGDFNLDGKVDAADYVAWRNGAAIPSEFNVWRTNFGKTAPGAGASLQTAVPEPTAGLLAIMALLCGTRLRRPLR